MGECKIILPGYLLDIKLLRGNSGGKSLSKLEGYDIDCIINLISIRYDFNDQRAGKSSSLMTTFYCLRPPFLLSLPLGPLSRLSSLGYCFFSGLAPNPRISVFGLAVVVFSTFFFFPFCLLCSSSSAFLSSFVFKTYNFSFLIQSALI